MPVPKIDKSLGMELYATKSPGISGVIKYSAEDFIVEELLVNGLKASVNGNEALGKAGDNQRICGKYLLCVLIKRDWDTFLAIKALARKMGLKWNDIHFAGIKDKRAITAQHITLRRSTIGDLGKVSIKGIEVHPIGFFHAKLSAHYLLGNQFRIMIRNIRYTEPIIVRRIAKIMDELREIGGIPNFFGHQRFGTIRPITHLVGKAILKGNLEEAVMLFLAKATPHEGLETRLVRERLWETFDFKGALKEFPKNLRYERMLLAHLVNKPGDFKGALMRLPRKLLRLFPQSYQSYLFNRFLSRRLNCSMPLNRAEVGDYVIKVDASGLPYPEAFTIVREDMLEEVNEAISKGKMGLALPMVGFRQKLSGGYQGEIEKEVLEEEEVRLEDFKSIEIPELRIRGSLRAALTPLKDFSLMEISEDEVYQGKRKVKVGFKLYKGAYATVFLREIMKPTDPVKVGF